MPAPDFEIAPGRKIGESHSVFIIAEIGQNHQGDINIAKQLIKHAKECGADCVKFQKTCLHERFNIGALSRRYDGPNSWGDTYGVHKAFLEFSDEQMKQLQKYATDTIGIMFAATPMDNVSLDLLVQMNVPFLKIGSGDSMNFPMLEYASRTGKPMVISTGMQSIKRCRLIYKEMKKFGGNFCFLHCVSAYPVPPESVHLRVIPELIKEFPDIQIGYSGHETGIGISTAAVALGARILERHITLDKSWRGSDHVCSLTPPELRELVQQVRTVENALGIPEKMLQPCEHDTYRKLGKSAVATRKMLKGEFVRPSDIKIKVAEPKGWPLDIVENLYGKILLRNIEVDESILLTDVM